MLMTSKELVLKVHREMGRSDALDLASRAWMENLDGTALIAEEEKVPLFVWGTDYSVCSPNTPVAEIVDGERQVFSMITPVNTNHYPGITPNIERSLYSLCHTKDPKKAKAWVAPHGISGLYQQDECCTVNGRVWRSIVNDNAYSPSDYPANWEDLGAVEEVT